MKFLFQLPIICHIILPYPPTHLPCLCHFNSFCSCLCYLPQFNSYVPLSGSSVLPTRFVIVSTFPFYYFLLHRSFLIPAPTVSTRRQSRYNTVPASPKNSKSNIHESPSPVVTPVLSTLYIVSVENAHHFSRPPLPLSCSCP